MARAPKNQQLTVAELGAIAHGPVVLSEARGRFLGLRSAVLYSSGLHLSVVVVGVGIYAEAMQRGHGGPFSFRVIDNTVTLLMPYGGRGEGNTEDRYYKESVFVLESVDSDELAIAAGWPGAGIEETVTRLRLPGVSELEMAIIPLP
ncbi:hypothetical protein [Antrihabitans spumae]|uniref:Uncharacterized protein n=1 Tax=Antrihabitans spumae TaxID=3373370 RepID=A0ABW7KJ76_9NOCA